MKWLVYILLLLPFLVVSQTQINLSEWSSNRIDLSHAEPNVTISGYWQGDRLIFYGTNDKAITFKDCKIESTHSEDAIVIAEQSNNLQLLGNNCIISLGGITFWNPVSNVKISGFSIHHPHTGIRNTGDHSSRNIEISNNIIIGAAYEGIYWGPHYATKNRSYGLKITDNTIIASGWDAIQGGNTEGLYIGDNNISHSGGRKSYGQDYGITVNPGSTAWLWNNSISNTNKAIQILNSKVFFHAPR